jgi:hypothetical protein
MLRLELSRLQTEAQEIEAELLREMRRQGRRPADGSDQPALFETDATPSMF